MFRLKGATAVLIVRGLVAPAALARSDEPGRSEREAMYYRYLEFPSYVKGGSIEPHWMADGSISRLAPGAPERASRHGRKRSGRARANQRGG